MIEFERLTEYKKYLNSIQAYLDKCFENQKEYIFCKKGCAHCCQSGSYPYSEIEFAFLLLGFFELDKDTQLKIQNTIKNILNDYKNTTADKIFHHTCPFLSDENFCCVYDYSGLVCRNFGILQISANDEILMPFCESLGLNYANVYDDSKEKFDYSLVEKLGLKNKPKPFPVTRNLLMDKDLFENKPLNFGETKPLIEWLKNFMI